MQTNELFWRHVKRGTGCWLWIGSGDHTGYGQIRVRGKIYQAHRRAWEISHGAIPEGLCVCHACDVKRCVRPSHLFLGTHKDNMQDARRKGLLDPGFKKGNRYHATLTAAQARAIRKQATKDSRGYWKRSDLAQKFGVSESTISRVLYRKTWTGV